MQPLEVPPQTVALARSTAAQLPLATGDPSLPDDDGWNDYAVALDPDLVMERFSSATLSRICDEVALQGQLLARSYLVEMASRVAPEEIVTLGTKQAAGIAGLASKRLAAALGAAPTLAGLAEVLAVHPLLLPAPTWTSDSPVATTTASWSSSSVRAPGSTRTMGSPGQPCSPGPAATRSSPRP